MIETFVVNNLSKNEEFLNSYNYFNYLLILGIIISLLAAYLAYTCNIKENKATQWVITIFAFLFPVIYTIYYFIVHVLLGYKCYKSKK